MLLRHKRARLADALRWTGALGLLERISREPGLVVLAYHRIADPGADTFYSSLISATPARFREQLLLLKSRYRFLKLHEIEDAIDDRGYLHLSEPCALITFDDGYRDNLTHALPVLRELGLPAALFLTTAFLDRALIPWWDRVAFILKTTSRDVVSLEEPALLHLDLAREGREAAIARLVAEFIASGWNPAPEALAHLHDRAEVAPATVHEAARSLFLSWSEARALAQSGIAIGAHTVTHRRLAGLRSAEQSRELVESKARIERELGLEIRALAYPFGDAGAFDDATKRRAREAGYALAFSLRPASARAGPLDPLELPRFNVLSADTPTQLRARLVLARRFQSPIV
jgi:peptidoglycan/xylan/chitin deacetylase (PgdA/CDA1 family)